MMMACVAESAPMMMDRVSRRDQRSKIKDHRSPNRVVEKTSYCVCNVLPGGTGQKWYSGKMTWTIHYTNSSQVAVVNTQTLATEFEITRPCSIPSDGAYHKVRISNLLFFFVNNISYL